MDIKMLQNARGSFFDLSQCPEFVEHAKDNASFAETIVKQINDGLYGQFAPIKEGDVVLDLGANVGLSALWFAGKAKAVYALEPNPTHFKVLKAMASMFAPLNVFPHRVAASATEGTKTFYTSNSNTTTGSLVKHSVTHDGPSFEVLCDTLANIIGKLGTGPIDLAKIDIEGGEAELIPELASGRLPIRAVFIEFHDFSSEGAAAVAMGRAMPELSEKWDLKICDPQTLYMKRKP